MYTPLRTSIGSFPVVWEDGQTITVQASALAEMMQKALVLPIALQNGQNVLAHKNIIAHFLQNGLIVPVLLTNGRVALAKPGLNGLFDIFKSKDRKEVESQLPELQSTVSSQSSQISTLTSNLQALQTSLQQKDQVIAQLNQKLSVAGSGGDRFKDPVFLGVSALALVASGFSIYKLVKG